ncbi:hypothetical protein T06_16219 [Trichinella sp. T6]|nr:hypothetical protein T06_16219 [Trichinella sp. T6]
MPRPAFPSSEMNSTGLSFITEKVLFIFLGIPRLSYPSSGIDSTGVSLQTAFPRLTIAKLCFNSLSVLATARRREGPWKSNTESSLPSIFSAFC